VKHETCPPEEDPPSAENMKHEIRRYKIYIIFAFIVAAGLAAAFLVSRGHYPAALVDGELISANRFALDYSAASLYYQNLLKTYGPAVQGGELNPMDLELAVMNQLIDESLIKEGAAREVGGDLQYLLENKLSKFRDDANLSRAAAAIYGLDENNFASEVLIPQATRDILAGRLFLRGQKIEDWLLAARKSARVVIFSRKFRWDGEKAVVR